MIDIKSEPVSPDVTKQFQWLSHPILRAIFPQNEVIAAAICDEDNGRYIVETLNPFPSFIPLPSDIKHTETRNKQRV